MRRTEGRDPREGKRLRRLALRVAVATVFVWGLGVWLGGLEWTQSSVGENRTPIGRVKGFEGAATGPPASAASGTAETAIAESGNAGDSGNSGDSETIRYSGARERAAQTDVLAARGEWSANGSREGSLRDASSALYPNTLNPLGDRIAVAPEQLSWLDLGRDKKGVLAHARGRDLAAPRALSLWRVAPGTGQAALLARSQSRADGSFAFERLLVSPREVHLVVVAGSRRPQSGESPFGDEASATATLAPARLPAPAVALVETDADGETWQLRMHAVSRAQLLVDDRWGASRYPIQAPARFAGRRNPTVLVEAPRGEQLLIAQQTPDGRRSGWVAVGGYPAVPARLGVSAEALEPLDSPTPLESREQSEPVEQPEHLEESQ